MNKQKLKMSYQIKEIPTLGNHKPRRIKESDLEHIAHIMLDAYMDTVDYEGESYEDAYGELKNVVNDGYGKYIENASFLIEQEGEAASAILINLFREQPLITYIFTAKKYSNQGHASTLIKSSIKALQEMGYKEVILYVTEENTNAVALYRKLGFIECNLGL